MADDQKPEALFTVQCGNRTVFAIAVLIRFWERHPLNAAEREFAAQRAQKHFGTWPVHFTDYPEVPDHVRHLFTGYRFMAECSAFDPQCPDTIEKAILVWHQQSATILLPDIVRHRLADIDWVSFAEPTDY